MTLTWNRSFYEITKEEQNLQTDKAEIEVEVFDADHPEQLQRLAVRAVVTASDGSHPDGSGFGVYADGRFFADGFFRVSLASGVTRMVVQSGPNYVPLPFSLDAAQGKKYYVRVFLHQWFSPEQTGWYSGDNHVHSQHDVTAAKQTGLAMTALQGRANGLSYITEAGSNQVSYENLDAHSTDRFLLKQADELGGACYMGHLITPGISRNIPSDRYEQLIARPLPLPAVAEEVHQLGGLVIYTHPLTPAHQLHWMGATGLYSDAVLGLCQDLFDVDSEATELLWFSVLNLGNKLAVSSYTDSTLERLHTLTPGDRRVYCRADRFDYPSIIEALRRGRTFATNGGPLFAFFRIGGYEPGDSVAGNGIQVYTVKAEVRSLHPLKKAELYRRGIVAHSFDVAGLEGCVNLAHDLREVRDSWYVFRVEDENGNWCITSPIYFEPVPSTSRPFASVIMLEIANHSRYMYLRRQFVAHLLVTVSQDDELSEVLLLKDGQIHQRYVPEMGNEMPDGKIPVTQSELNGDYLNGWIWHAELERTVHFQADCPLQESGWYSIRLLTKSGIVQESEAAYFDGGNPDSHELSTVRLSGGDTVFELCGYGADMPLAEIREPALEDGWWYPKGTAWRLRAVFGGQEREICAGQGTEADVRRKLSGIFKS
jgi:hypothetical protein